MIKLTVPVKGMHCRSCEILIEDNIKDLQGVLKVHADNKKKKVEIISERSLSKSLISKAIQDAGYEVGIEETSLITKDLNAYKELVTAILLLVIVYVLATIFGLGKFATSTSSSNSNLAVVFTVGLTAGLSTCMALVGGLILGVSARHAEKHPEATPLQKFRPHIFFNLGRLSSFFLLGGTIGLLGSVFKLSGTALGAIAIVVGFVMFFLGLQLINIFPKLSSGFTLPKSISRLFKIDERHKKEYSHKNSFVLGVLTFFMPCGFTQAMQVLAISSGSFVKGALIMGVFALGTTPGLIGIGGITSVAKNGYFSRLFFKFVGVLVIALSIFNMSNGLNLTGIKPYFASALFSENNSKGEDIKLENGVQLIKMEQGTFGYSPNKLTVKVGIPVKWVINSTDSNTCASSLYVSKLKISKTLNKGENVIEFTPKENGKISFSCSMGMYTGYINVVENSDNPSNPSVNSNSNLDKSDNSTNTNPSGSNEGNATVNPKAETPPAGPIRSDLQVIKATYTVADQMQPKSFNAKSGKPIRFEIEAKEDGVGCMSAVMIPGIDNKYQILEAGKTVVFEFTAEADTYKITCAMGIPFGTLTVSN